MATMALSLLLLFPSMLLLLLSSSICLSDPIIAAAPTPSTSFSVSEIEDLKAKVSRLETKLEETNQLINAKIRYAVNCEKRIEELNTKINDLQASLSSLKSATLDDARVIAVEEEVRALWDSSRKNNFLLHMLESRVEDAEERLESITSQVEKMSGIVTELWIEIQQLEQALQSTEVRVLELYKQRRSARCIVFKVVDGVSRSLSYIMHLFSPYVPKEGSFWRIFTSEAREKIEGFFEAMKKYHHHLQWLVRQQMERYDLTASFANEELVFFVASALLVFPLLGALSWLSSDQSL